MADNMNVTPGSGKTIAADDVGGALHQRVKLSVGADGSATDLAFGQAVKAASLPVTIASDETVLTSSTDRILSVAGTVLTRPANTTAYTAGDSISDNATAGSVTALPVTVSDINDAPVAITEIELDTTDTGLAAGGQVDVFVFNSDPTANSGVGAGDNAAYSNKRAGFRARFRGTFTAFSDGGKAICRPVDGDNSVMAVATILPETGGRRLWYQVKAVTAFTPSANSTTITPRFKGFQARA